MSSTSMQPVSPAHVVQWLSEYPDVAPVSNAAAKPLATYVSELMYWNARTNLVGKSDARAVVTDLVLDSVVLASVLAEQAPQAALSMDLGAGAGLPGIPLRTLWTPGECLLVEARAKRCVFMRKVLAQMGMAQTGQTATRVLQCRTEDVSADLQGRVDVVLSRAYKPWRQYVADASRLVRPAGGLVVVMAREACEPHTLPDGYSLQHDQAYTSGAGARHLWVLRSI